MIPIPTSKVFRSRYGALRWCFWVLVFALTTVPFLPSGHKSKAAVTTDATGEVVDQADLQAVASALNAN